MQNNGSRLALSGKSIFVTGAAGFIGSHFINQLSMLEQVDFTALDNERSGDWSRLNVDINQVNVDIGQLEQSEMCRLLEGSDILVHFAAEKHNSSKFSPDAVFKTNVMATSRLFRAAAEVGIQHILFTSSLYANGNTGPDLSFESDTPVPSTDYGISKLAGELILRRVANAHGIRWHSPRLYFIYGPNQFAEGGYKSVIKKNMDNAKAGLPLTICGDGKQGLDYVYIDDAIRAFKLMLESNFSTEVTNVASSKCYSIEEVVGEIGKVSGTTKIQYEEADSTHGTKRFGDNHLIFEKIGWKPTITLSEGLEKTWKSSQKV